MSGIVNLLSYSDYRKFLKDFFKKKKEIRTSYSQRYFAQKAGFSDHSQLTHLVSGRRNVTDDTLNKLLKGLDFDGSDKEYFICLVKFNQAKTKEDKEEWHLKLNAIRKKLDIHKVTVLQHKYFEEWYYPIILELAPLDIWEDDYKKLAELVRPSITEKQAEKALKLLVKIKMLDFVRGKYKKPQNVVMPGTVPHHTLRKARDELIKLGIEASNDMQAEERHIMSYGFTISPGNKEKYDELINEFQHNLNALVLNENEEPEGMYQCNLQFFPLTRKLK